MLIKGLTADGVLRELVAADNDATWVQLAERLGERTEVSVSSSTISRPLS